jgi:zinc transporter 1
MNDQVRSTSFILLQGVPPTISLEDVRNAILQVKGVHSIHELHIWQLSESKVVASVHVTASRNEDFMRVAIEIQEALHHRGIHSSTIQPEYDSEEITIIERLPGVSDLVPLPPSGVEKTEMLVDFCQIFDVPRQLPARHAM